MPEARQLCQASSTVAVDDRPRATCPFCGSKVTVTQHERVQTLGQIEYRPIIPAHIRDVHGEMRAKVAGDKARYPR